MFGPAWTSPVPFPYHLDTPSQPPTAPSQPLPQPHNRTKRNRPPHDTPSSSLHPPSSLLFTPHPTTPHSPSLMTDIHPPSSAKARLIAAGFPPTPTSHTPSTNPLPHPSPTPLSPHLLRRLTLLYLSHHQYTSAIFYADKLCSLTSPYTSSPPSPIPPLSRLLLLATALHRHGQHRRAIHLLRNRTVVCHPHTLANGVGEMEEVHRWVEEGGEGDEGEGEGEEEEEDMEAENDGGRANRALRSSAAVKAVPSCSGVLHPGVASAVGAAGLASAVSLSVPQPRPG